MKSNFQTVLQKLKSNGQEIYDIDLIIDEYKDLGMKPERDELENHLLQSPKLNFHSTRNDVAHVMAEIGRSYHPESLADISCGIGNILVHCDFAKSIGFDIDQGVIQIAKFLSPNLNFCVADSLISEKIELYNAIISHFPYGSYLDGDKKIVLERDFVKKALSRLTDGGVLVCLVSNGFLSQRSYTESRSRILESHYLAKVISLKQPAYVNSALKSSILVIEKDKRPNKKTQYIERNSLNDVLDLIKKDESDFERQTFQLEERWDYQFQKPLSKSSADHLASYKTKSLGELVEITVGVSFSEYKYAEPGEYSVIGPRAITNDKVVLDGAETFTPDLTKQMVSRAIIREGDIVLPRIHMERFKLYTHHGETQKWIANQNMFLLRGENAEYVSLYLKTDEGKKYFFEQKSKLITSSIIPVLSLSDLKRIQIPILPISDLRLASKKRLEQLSPDELIKIKDDYAILQKKYQELEEKHQSRPHQEQLDGLQNMLNQVLANQGIIQEELTDIKKSLMALSEEFQTVKNLPRDVESKMKRFYKQLDLKLDQVKQGGNEIEFYVEEIKRWFEYYDILEEKSQKYLPEAEYLLDKIAELDNADYSPFILQYCRALENELLKKIFRAYVQSLKERDIDLKKSFEWDLGFKDSGRPNNENTRRLANDLIKYLKKPESQWFFELGNMEFRLRFLTGKTASKSPLLQDFRSFVLERFRDDLLNIEYLDDIKSIIKNYRNESAHPGLISAEQAKQFHKGIKEILTRLLENYR